MSHRPITRRDALSLLSALPLVARSAAQAPPARLRRVSLAMYHSLLLDSDGTLKCWSHPAAQAPNDQGQLGLGHFDPVEEYKLYPVPGLTHVVAAATALDMSFAVLADGRILSWGKRGDMLGITPLAYLEIYADTGPKTHTPAPVAVRFDAVDISVGSHHVLALARDGTVWAWGDGRKGQLGIGALPVINFKTRTPSAMSYVPFPVQIPGLTDVVAISAGVDHSMALLKDGTMRAWGGNKYGQVGDGTTVDRPTPVLVPGIGKAIAIAARSYSVAVLEDGGVLTWGDNMSGNLGRPWKNDGTPAPVPGFVPGVADGRAVAAGNHVLILTQAGTVVSWGYNGYGNLGYGGTTYGFVARTVRGLTGVHSVTVHANASLAVLDDGRIVGWGGGHGHPWISLRGGSTDVRGSGPTPILLNVDGLDNG